MNSIKQKIKGFLPDKYIYFYRILQLIPAYLESCIYSSWVHYPKIQFYNNEETVNKIVFENKSLCRFGDGEFFWMIGKQINSFEIFSRKLQHELIGTIQVSNPNLLIGIPYGIVDSTKCKICAKMHWKIIRYKYFSEILQFIDTNKIYSDASITRPYIDYNDREFSKMSFENLKRIWNDQDLVIVEGMKTKLGIGNDLFDNAKSIKRILCPAENAFEKYDLIKKSIVRNVDKNQLILAALGPTATILAAEMCGLGYHIVDIGHIDIEYMWYLNHSILRDKIEGKSVNESGNRVCSDFYEYDCKYIDSIIDRVN